MIYPSAIAMTLALTLSACATPAPGDPIVDRPGPNYATDLAECRALGDKAPTVQGGLLLGIATGGAVGHMQRDYVVRMCLAGRGYRVLG